MKKNRFIAVADILGFKNLVTDGDLLEIVHKIISLDNITKQPQFPFILPIKDGEHRVYRRDGDFEEIEPLEFKVNYTIFSDTILMYSDSEDERHIVGFFYKIIEILKESVELDIPLRIGISYGESYIDEEKNYYVGQAIVDAYELEQNQEWIGGSFHSSCRTSSIFESIIEPVFTIKYNKHFKSQTSFDLALNWINPVGNTTIEAIMKVFLKPLSIRAKKKWFTTLEFILNSSSNEFSPKCKISGKTLNMYSNFSSYHSKEMKLDYVTYLKQEDEMHAALANYVLGEFYYNGSLVEKNIELAKKYLNKSYTMGFKRAGNYLAMIQVVEAINESEGLKQNINLIEDCLSEDTLLAFNTGLAFLSGANGLQKDYEKARIYLERAFLGFDLRACVPLSEIYNKGLGVEKNIYMAQQLIDVNTIIKNSKTSPNTAYTTAANLD